MLAYLRWTFYHILRDIFDMVGIEGLRAKMAKKGKSVNTGKHRESSTNFLFCRCQLLSAEGKEVGDDILRCLPVFVDVYLFAFSLET